jgi:hypothetical protein
MNRVVVQEGYALPFEAYRRKKRRSSHKRHRGGPKAQQNKMKKCAKSWKTGSYKSHMKRCLKK